MDTESSEFSVTWHGESCTSAINLELGKMGGDLRWFSSIGCEDPVHGRFIGIQFGAIEGSHEVARERTGARAGGRDAIHHPGCTSRPYHHHHASTRLLVDLEEKAECMRDECDAESELVRKKECR